MGLCRHIESTVYLSVYGPDQAEVHHSFYMGSSHCCAAGTHSTMPSRVERKKTDTKNLFSSLSRRHHRDQEEVGTYDGKEEELC